MRAVSNRGSERREDAGRVAERWPSEAETPERRVRTPRAASPGGYEAAPRRQRREAQDAEAGRDGAAGGGVRRDGSTGERGMLQCSGGRGIFLVEEGGLR